MAWCRGFQLLSSTRTGRTMIGGAVASSTGTALLMNRNGKVSTRLSVASGAALCLAQLGAIAYLGHRLVRAGEDLAAQAVFGTGPRTPCADGTTALRSAP